MPRISVIKEHSMADREKPVIHTKKHIARLARERQQTRIILGAFIGILVVVIGLLVYGYLDVTYLQARQPVASVGETDISTQAWQTRVRLERRRLIGQYVQYQQYQQAFGMDLSSQLQQFAGQLNSPETMGQSILDLMIDEEVVRQEAAKRGITVSPEELDAAIQAQFGFFPNGSPTPTITPTDVSTPTLSPQTLALVTLTPTPTLGPTATLEPSPTPDILTTPTETPTVEPTATTGPTSTPEPTATPYTLEGFQAELKQSNDSLAEIGLSEADLRRLFETNLLREKLFEAVTEDVKPVQEQVWARHILVPTEESARTVRGLLQAGGDFAALALAFSQDQGSAPNGGDLGWFGKGVMVAPFEEAAFSLKVGEFSEPIKSDFGYHIIQVLAREPRPLNDSEFQQARQQAFSDWMQSARAEYDVKTFDYWKERVPTEPALPTQ